MHNTPIIRYMCTFLTVMKWHPCAGRSEATPAVNDMPCGAGTYTGRSSRSISFGNVVVWVTKPAAVRMITCDLGCSPSAMGSVARP